MKASGMCSLFHNKILAFRYGTAYLDESIVIKLINTCPINSYLTIFYMYLKSHPAVLNYLISSSSCENYAKCLTEVVSPFEDEEYGSGKVQWLKQFPQFNFAPSGTVDVWGCKQDMILPCLSPIFSNSVSSFCDSPDCPQGDKLIQRSSRLIVNGGLEKRDDRTYLESMLEFLLHPKREPCGAEFKQRAPLPAKKRVVEPRMLISFCDATEIGESSYCGGTCKSEPKEFKNGLPWVLPVFLGNLAQTEHLKGPAELLFHVHVLGCRYSLGGLTFWNGIHYKGRFVYEGKWYNYDGLQRNPLKDILCD